MTFILDTRFVMKFCAKHASKNLVLSIFLDINLNAESAIWDTFQFKDCLSRYGNSYHIENTDVYNGNSVVPLQWHHNERDSVSNHRRRDCLLGHKSKKIKENIEAPRHWPCEGNSPVTSEFPKRRASNAEIVSIWWRHHVLPYSNSWIGGENGGDYAE